MVGNFRTSPHAHPLKNREDRRYQREIPGWRRWKGGARSPWLSAGTRGNTKPFLTKKANPDGLAFWYWWRRGPLNQFRNHLRLIRFFGNGSITYPQNVPHVCAGTPLRAAPERRQTARSGAGIAGAGGVTGRPPGWLWSRGPPRWVRVTIASAPHIPPKKPHQGNSAPTARHPAARGRSRHRRGPTGSPIRILL